MGRKRKPPQGPRLDDLAFLLHAPGESVTAWFPPGWIGEPTCRGFILFEEEDCDGEQIAVTFYDACMYGDHEIRLEDVVALEPEQTGFGCELCEIDDDDAPKAHDRSVVLATRGAAGAQGRGKG